MPEQTDKLNPEVARDYRQLGASIANSCTKKRKFEEHRMKLFKRWVGPDFGDYGCKERRPVNMYELGIDLLSRFITAHEIEALIQTEFRELAPTAYDFEIVLNRRLGVRELNLAESLSICAIESLFTLGVMCVGLDVQGEMDPGKVFAQPVLFPDLIVDMTARSWQSQKYIGHDFLIAFDDLRNSPIMEGRARDEFVKRRDVRSLNGRDWDGGGGMSNDEFRNMVPMRQLYIPHDNRVIICDPSPDSTFKTPLMSNEWQGPDGGPYTPLYYKPVPGHVLPLAIAPFWYDLDDLLNKTFGKSGNQALRSKVIGVTRNESDAATIKKASDGEIVKVDSPEAVIEKHFGGSDPSLVGMFNLAKSLLVYIGGNWDALGGLAPMSNTASQDQLLTQSATGRVQDMQTKMMVFETKVITDIGYWLWTDPVSTERFAKKIQGTRFSVDDGMWSPENRTGDFFQYNFSVNPHKRIRRSPDEQANGLIALLTQVILPAMPYMQQGSPIDWEQLFEIVARYSNYPELREIIRWPQGDSLPGPQPEMPTKPNVSTRTYQRVNRTEPGRTDPMQDITKLFSQNPQGAENSPLTV